MGEYKGLFKDSVIYGIAQDNPANTPHEQCRYDVCLVVNADLDCMVDESGQRGEMDGGKYAVFTIAYTAEAVQEFWSSFMQGLQAESLQIDTSKPILERYKYKLVENGQCEVCVPIT